MHQDYILRMIQQLSMFVTRVLRLREEEDYDAAIVEIHEAYSRIAGLPASLVLGLSEENLLTMMSAHGSLTVDRCLAVASLLREEAITYDEMGDLEAAYPRYVKSLRFYLEVVETSSDIKREEIPGLDDVARRISAHPLPERVRTMLLAWLEQTGQFDLAENVLMSWVENSDSEEAVESSVAFYDRLLARTDAELIIGGVTRGEVRDALRDMADAGKSILLDAEESSA